MSKKKVVGDYKALLGNEKTVLMLEETMAQFQRMFHDAIQAQVEFSVYLEVRGDKGKVSYFGVRDSAVRRPVWTKSNSMSND